MKDIYFDLNYGKLYEKVEQGKAVCWKYEGIEGCVSHQFILRKIPIETDDGPWYDIVTPYGYGGPVVETVREGFRRETLVSRFQKAFSAYCLEQKIISEFVRFHPLIDNASDFASVYNAVCIRNTLGTNLKDYDDPIGTEFSKSCRKSIRQAVRKGVTWRVAPCPEQIDSFKSVYYSTMDRNHANDYYYFDDDYFRNCLTWFREKILLVEAIFEGKVIAAGFYFVSGKTIHVHLSGTLSEYLYLSPAYILKYATALWGKENGFELIYYGGGRSNRTDDELYLFKKKFSQTTEFPFWIGKKIWNEEIYEKLCKARSESTDSQFFPAYRA